MENFIFVITIISALIICSIGTFKEFRINRYLFYVIWIIFIFAYKLAIENGIKKSINKEIIIEQEITIGQIDTISIAEQLTFADSIYNYILFLNIKHPEVVMRQFQIESANFTSKIFKQNKNLCGMKIPFKRPNLVVGEKGGYAVYDSWQDCIIDYALWQVYSGKNLNREEYINLLNNSYAEDPLYAIKIK